MTSMRELFAVPPKSTKNFIAMNVRNIHKKQDNTKAAKVLPTVQTRILKEKNGPIRKCASSKVLNYQTCQTSDKNRPKAYRNAGSQTIDFEMDASLLEDGVIRYPSSKWKERSTQEHQFKSIALQTEPKPKFDTDPCNQAGASSSNEEINEIIAAGESSHCDNNENQHGNKAQIVLEKNIDRLNINPVDHALANHHKSNQQNPKTTCISKDKKIASKSTNSLSSSNISTQCKAPVRHKRGVVPRYIIEKKLEKEREQKRILDEAERTGILDPDCPPGHILLPTAKRLEQLEFLKKNYKSLINELNRIPVRNDSLKIRQHRVLVEKELDKLEEAIKLFSKEKLFVKP